MMNVSCAYCGTEVKIDTNSIGEETCTFCGAKMRSSHSGLLQLCQNEQRFEFYKMQQNVFLEQVNESVEVLKQLHTFDLYLLLKEVREARSQTFTGLRVLNKALDQDAQFKDTADEVGNDYEYYTRKAWVIENILLERQGYFPEKITEKILTFMWSQIKKSRAKPMQISKTKRKQKSS
ncbi:hypothetical protein [Bacillus wiedmannii]|uniref:hypothetical protein n=1 Tax=Bacillus wiedmannii TaxID=1890302 RepID=UPI000BEE6B14|nr:hypothetical protein [Bacillus wiedmannii]PDZ43732.1 hypothetical protein CON82_22600 [Bacillus wiedmannii]